MAVRIRFPEKIKGKDLVPAMETAAREIGCAAITRRIMKYDLKRGGKISVSDHIDIVVIKPVFPRGMKAVFFRSGIQMETRIAADKMYGSLRLRTLVPLGDYYEDCSANTKLFAEEVRETFDRFESALFRQLGLPAE